MSAPTGFTCPGCAGGVVTGTSPSRCGQCRRLHTLLICQHCAAGSWVVVGTAVFRCGTCNAKLRTARGALRTYRRVAAGIVVVVLSPFLLAFAAGALITTPAERIEAASTCEELRALAFGWQEEADAALTDKAPGEAARHLDNGMAALRKAQGLGCE